VPPAADLTDLHAVSARMRWQAEWCDRLGSPLYGELLLRAADDADAGGPVAAALAGRESDPLESMLQLRFMGAVHRLALAGRAPALADVYPSTGGSGGDAWPAFRATVEEHLDELRELVERPVQTNEVGRSRALVLGFLLVAAEAALPLRLLELGSSAGLNLRWDAFHYRSGEFEFGDAGAPVQFLDYLEGRPPALPTQAGIVERAGCDERPVYLDEDGQLTLRSYVWPDQVERFRQLEGALAVAPRIPVRVERAGGAEWLERRLGEPAEGACTVVFHSIVMQYVEPSERDRIDGLIAAAGARATERAPLAHLALEPGGEHAHLRLTMWPAGEERLLAEAGYHGEPVRWVGG
jgi:hypothetical protein